MINVNFPVLRAPMWKFLLWVHFFFTSVVTFVTPMCIFRGACKLPDAGMYVGWKNGLVGVGVCET